MQRALLISTENPFPADSGGRLRLRGILDVLADRFAIDLVTYERPESPDHAAARARLNLVQVRRSMTPRAAALRGLYRGRTCGYMGHADVDMMAAARALCATEAYHAVFIDNTVLGYFIPPLRRLQPQARFVTIAHNFETSLCRQLAAAQRSPLRRLLFAISALHTRREETRVCRLSDLLLTTSAAEAASFAALDPDVATRTVVIPSCLDTGRYAAVRYQRPAADSIVFSGDMAYFPNVAAAQHFHAAIYPALRARRPGIRWRIVGRNPHPSLLEIAARDRSVEVTGYVDDAAAAIAESAVVVVPLLHGSGTRLKILEAWAVDRPVVTTPKGCEGLICRDGHDLVVADAGAAFVAGICRVLDDATFAARLVRQARQTLLAHYDVRTVATPLLAALDGAPASPDGGRDARTLAS